MTDEIPSAQGATELENIQHERFCREYVVDFNASAAAERAGYSAATAGQQGSRLLKNVHIQERVKYLASQALERADVDAADVIRELARVGFSDVWNYVIDENGDVDLAADAPPDASRAVASIKKRTRVLTSSGGETTVEHHTEIRLWDKVAALEKLARYKDVYPDAKRRRGTPDEPLVIQIVR